MRPIYLITGATGKQGGATAEHLIRRGYRVRAMTRNPDSVAAENLRIAGAEIVQGDFDVPQSMREALQQVAGLFLVSHYWDGVELEIERGIRAAELAAESDIDHLVYTSVARYRHDRQIPHFASKRRIEKRIKELGLPYTFLRPVAFMENWQWPVTRMAIMQGKLISPLSSDTPYQQISVVDIGDIAARILSSPEHWIGRSLELAADSRTMKEIADTFERVLDMEVRYEQQSWEEIGDDFDSEMMRFFEKGGFDVDMEAARSIHPGLMSFEDYLEKSGWADAKHA